jgi:hypothetical protein
LEGGPTFNPVRLAGPVAKETKKQHPMKSITKLAFIAAVAALGTGVALADNAQQAKLLELQRQQVERNQAAATVAVYDGHGVRHHHTTAAVVAERVDVPTQLARDSHGGFYIVRAETTR